MKKRTNSSYSSAGEQSTEEVKLYRRQTGREFESLPKPHQHSLNQAVILNVQYGTANAGKSNIFFSKCTVKTKYEIHRIWRLHPIFYIFFSQRVN